MEKRSISNPLTKNSNKKLWMLAKKLTRTNFMLTWFVVAIREARDRFHQNFAMGLEHIPYCIGV
jgi:hypothetical protein